MTRIVVENLHKTYRMGNVYVPVLRGVSLTIQSGEFVAILGASGSGKSTLLHLIGALDVPDHSPEPRILFDDREIYRPLTSLEELHGKRFVKPLFYACGFELYYQSYVEWRAWPMYRFRASSIGFVFQFYHLFPELSVLENVLVAAMVRHGRFGYRARRGDLVDRATLLLDRVGLSHRLKHRPAELSGGERQRVALARALVNDPPVLLADEPTGNLDRQTGASILDALTELRGGAKRTMVIVTHDPETAARADRVVRLVDGKVAADQASRRPAEPARAV